MKDRQQTDPWADGHTDIRTDQLMDGWTHGLMNRETDEQRTYRQTDRQIGELIDMRTDGQIDGRADGQTNRPTVER